MKTILSNKVALKLELGEIHIFKIDENDNNITIDLTNVVEENLKTELLCDTKKFKDKNIIANVTSKEYNTAEISKSVPITEDFVYLGGKEANITIK